MENANVMEPVWAVEQEILDVFHNVCTTYNLHYSLGFGTLLGAVRHSGFIPWDDDIDIVMPRNDYEKLLSMWDSVAPKGYLLLNHHYASDYPNNFSKIVKDHTTFLQDEWARDKNFHKGFFIDIFPAERLAPGFVRQKIQYLACAVNLLYSKNYTSGTGGIVGLVERILLKLPLKTRKKWRQITENYVKRWASREDCKCFLPCTIQECANHYPSTIFSNIKTILFQGKRYCCVVDTDTVLKIEYGDYMSLPPEEERIWTHHPILIDFERNYEEIEE